MVTHLKRLPQSASPLHVEGVPRRMKISFVLRARVFRFVEQRHLRAQVWQVGW